MNITLSKKTCGVAFACTFGMFVDDHYEWFKMIRSKAFKESREKTIKYINDEDAKEYLRTCSFKHFELVSASFYEDFQSSGNPKKPK